MYHSMLTLAVAQARLDDLTRDLSQGGSRWRPAASDPYGFDASPSRPGLSVRFSRYAARRHRPSPA